MSSNGPKSILPRAPSNKAVTVTVARGTLTTHEGSFGPGERCQVPESDLPRLYAARVVRDPKTIERPGDADAPEAGEAVRVQTTTGAQIQVGRVPLGAIDPTGA